MFKLSRPTVGRLSAIAALVCAPAAQAIIVYSGAVNLAIPNTTTGLYVNVLDGSSFSGPGTFPTLPGPGANYDFNIFGAATWSFFSPGTTGLSPPAVPGTSRGYVATTTTGAVAPLAAGTLIDNASVYNIGTPSGSAMSTGTTQIFGFRFRNEGADLSTAADDTVHFGWARVVLSAGVPGTLIDYAFESVPLAGIQAGVVPEPGSWALLAGGLVGMAGWLRRRQQPPA